METQKQHNTDGTSEPTPSSQKTIRVSLLVPYSLSATHGNSVRVKSMVEHNVHAQYSVFSYDLPWVGPKNASIPLTLTLQAAYNRLLRRLPITDLLVCERAPQSLVEAYTHSSVGSQLLQAENLWSIPIAAKTGGSPILTTLHDVYSDRIRELLTYFGASQNTIEHVAKRVLRLEQQLIPQMDACVLVSQADLERYRQLEVSMSRPTVIPNGVDTQRYKPLPLENREAYRRKYGLGDKPVILFTGSDMYQNRQAVATIADTLRRLEGSSYELVVAGSISKFAEKHFTSRGLSAKTLGYVESLTEVYAAADIVFAPMVSGTGTKLKILEAMACGKPVLTTPKGTRGLDLDNTCIAVGEPEELPVKLKELLSDRELCDGLGQRAREAALKYDWRTLMPQYTQLYNMILNR